MSDVLFAARIPVDFHGSKKNSKSIRINRKTKSPFISSNDRILKLQSVLANRLILEARKNRIEKITVPVNLKFTFLFPESIYYTKAGVRSKRLPDISNLYELPQDVMQSIGLIENDGLIESHDGSRRLPIKGDQAYLEIEITRVKDIQIAS